MSGINRRSVLRGIGAASIVGLAGCAGGGDEAFPNDDITSIVPYGPGGGVDAYAQGYTPLVGEELGVNVQIDHIEGAAGLRGLGELAGSKPDGYTIGQASPPAEILPALVDDPGFDQTEFTGIAQVGFSSVTGIINRDYEIDSYDALIDAYQDGEFTQVGGLDEGGQQHAAALVMRDQHGLDFDTYVPYGGTGAAEEAVIGDEVPFALGTDAGFQSAVDAEEANPVAILTAEQSGVFPDWPTVVDEGYDDIDFIGAMNRLWVAPPGVDDDVQQTLEEAFEAAANSDELAEWEEDTGNTVTYGDGATAEQILQETFDEIPEAVDMDELSA